MEGSDLLEAYVASLIGPVDEFGTPEAVMSDVEIAGSPGYWTERGFQNAVIKRWETLPENRPLIDRLKELREIYARPKGQV